MGEQKRRAYFNGRDWFNKKVEQRTDAALEKIIMESAMEHAETSIEDLYQQEYKQQKQLLVKELRERRNQKTEAKKKQSSQDNQKQEEKRLLLKKECEWVKTHQNDTDDELLAYVAECAKQLGHTPYRNEVMGSQYIKERFGGWYEVLLMAKLPIPKDMKPPSQKKKRQIQQLKYYTQEVYGLKIEKK